MDDREEKATETLAGLLLRLPTVPLTFAGFPEAKNPEREKGSDATKARSAPPAVDRAGMGTSRGGLVGDRRRL